MSRKVSGAIAVAVLLLGTAAPAVAQVDRATLTGVVRHPSKPGRWRLNPGPARTPGPRWPIGKSQ